MQRDKKIIEASEIKTKGPYLSLMDSSLKKVESDFYQNRRFLRTNGIKIYEENGTEKTVDIKFLIRGYKHTASFPWYVLKHSVESMMKTYFGLVE